MFVIRSLEPDKSGGKKQISKEFLTYSNQIMQDDPAQAIQQEKLMQEQKKAEKKKIKKKEVLKRRKE